MRETNLASLISEVLTEKNNPYVALLRLYSLLTCYALHAKGNMYRLPDNITIPYFSTFNCFANSFTSSMFASLVMLYVLTISRHSSNA